ncbi:MAG: hypothetical protein A2036_00015 [Omnitrophica bacterium GWA2_50_21]|nr:MAG: hypothetical protein A2036_00015 [Omnitrophica bacterium GWA2_50_21]
MEKTGTGKQNNMKKILGYIAGLAFFYAALFFAGSTPFGQSLLQASTFTAAGSITPIGTLNVTLQNGSSLSGSGTATTFNFAQYLKVDYYSNLSGYQAVLIYTDNSIATANPKYTGFGDGAGLIKTTATNVNVPMHWVVFTTPQSGGYNFHPINPDNEFFVVDKKRPDGSAFPAGFASFIYDVREAFSLLAAAPLPDRSTNSGTVYVYLAANFAGQSAGTYKTSTLSFDLVTLNNGAIVASHQKRTFTATVAAS